MLHNHHIIDNLPSGGITYLPNRIIPFMWFFVRQIKERFFMLLLLGIIAGVCSALAPYFFGRLVDVFIKTPTGTDIWVLLKEPLLQYTITSLILAPALYNTQGWLMSVSLGYFANMIRRQLAVYMYGHSYKFFQNDFAGRLAGKIIEMPFAIRMIIGDITGPFTYAAITFIVTLVVFSTIGAKFAIFTAIYIILYSLNTLYFIPRVQKLSEALSISRSLVRGRYFDILSNILLVKIFARSQHEDHHFKKLVRDHADGVSKEELTITRMFRVQHVLNSSFMLSLIYATILGWQAGTLSAGEISMILPMSLSMVNATFWLTEVYTQFFQRLGEVREGMEAVIAEHDIINVPNAPELQVKSPSIEWRDVTFTYPSRPMFTNFNLNIPAKQRIGLVGPSGAGKSTFVQLLLRLHDVQGGGIFIDGQNIANVTQDSLREHIAMIPQNADLMHRSIRDNIAYGRLDASDEDIIAAAKQAEAHDFIVGLSDKNGKSGYDALVGERGVKLSGGQRQRIAIARAILKNAPILVLDEATASLDSESEKLIQKSLETIMKDRTVIVIAHRLSTIAHLDRLIVMQDGKIIEDGTHKELIDHNGLYARLWSLQSGGFL
jgi:ATP-binding cassette subfamily B multidrug efflux pump